MMRLVRALAIWFVPAFGYAAALGLILSPWIVNRLSVATGTTVRVSARITSCTPHRDGANHKSAIVCGFRYVHAGRAYVAQSEAWDSRSPFLTSAGLARALEEQSTLVSRPADLRPRDPGGAVLADLRPLTVPPLWLWLIGLFVAMVVAAIRLDPSGMPHRRAELTPDPITGHLVATDNRHRDRLRRRIALQCLAGIMAMAICLFGLSNLPFDIVAKLGMTTLRPVPARLIDCAHHHHGGNKGSEQIDCAFDYRVGGRLLTGQAESLHFGLFPSNARMDAEVARLPDGTQVTAYVDPHHPDYAWAFIRQDWFVPFTWGLFGLELWIIVMAIAIGLIVSIPRWLRPERDDS